jgi:hypothetical protein
MAGNCNAACAKGYLSLAKERIRVAPKTQQLFPILQLNALPLSQGRDAKRKRLHYFEFTRPSTPGLQPTTSCGWRGWKALQMVCFSLVTLTRVLY